MIELLIETLEWYAAGGSDGGERAKRLLQRMESSDGENMLPRLVDEVSTLIESQQDRLTQAGIAVEKTLAELSDG